MNTRTILDIIRLIGEAIEAAVAAGRPLREALAEELEDAAAKIRAGEINIGDAVDRAREDQRLINILRDRKG